MNKGPLIIAGFGRSGTTWLSDILSKCLQGIILFEPFHPVVFQEAESVCYSNFRDKHQLIKEQWIRCKQNPPENPWLIRNHLPFTENVSREYINYLWNNSKIIGFKTIRLNHALSELRRQLDARIIYIYRSPLCVLMSVNRRSNFWNEFSWNWHAENFFKRTISEDNFSGCEIRELNSILDHVNSQDETILAMWAVSFLIAMRQVHKYNFLSLCYEDLYRSPYEYSTRILRSLDVNISVGFHPSYFFTPSMTSLRTIHVKRKHSLKSNADVIKYFLDKSLSKESLKNYANIINSIVSIQPEIRAIIEEKQYLRLEDQMV